MERNTCYIMGYYIGSLRSPVRGTDWSGKPDLSPSGTRYTGYLLYRLTMLVRTWNRLVGLSRPFTECSEVMILRENFLNYSENLFLFNDDLGDGWIFYGTFLLFLTFCLSWICGCDVICVCLLFVLLLVLFLYRTCVQYPNENLEILL